MTALDNGGGRRPNPGYRPVSTDPVPVSELQWMKPSNDIGTPINKEDCTKVGTVWPSSNNYTTTSAAWNSPLNRTAREALWYAQKDEVSMRVAEPLPPDDIALGVRVTDATSSSTAFDVFPLPASVSSALPNDVVDLDNDMDSGAVQPSCQNEDVGQNRL